ncbi:GntR family transcriptional regulator [Ferviditalea candida]|uniref:GntR family transcriptional regulator n=1 Tax=Ferviditalea candida TaxID=3108399 RepID=A0ABU5ZEP3_9BACL|nr:GntR family transcriptional regulator [Paenibacillaceae bacterium T2]
MTKLNLNSPIPLHIQLRDIIREAIYQGKFTDDRLPSERELMDLYSVSRTTVRDAVSALVREGVLEKQHGKGTFISLRPIEEWLGNIKSYNAAVEEMGMRPGSKLLQHGRVESEHVGSILETDEIYMIERLRFADDHPIAIEKQYYPLDIGMRLAEKDLDTAILYHELENSLGIILSEAEESITAALPSAEEAAALGIPETMSVLSIERITQDPQGKPVEYLHAVYRSDMYSFRIKLMRAH